MNSQTDTLEWPRDSNNLQANHMLHLLSKLGLEAVLNSQSQLMYYQNASCIVFPPVTDKVLDENKLPLLSSVVEKARALPEFSAAKMIFPLYEANDSSVGGLSLSKLTAFTKQPTHSRKHWVTVICDLEKNTTVLVDATGERRMSLYKTELLDQALEQAGLPKVTKPIALNIQPLFDSVSSGHWTVAVIKKTLQNVADEVLLSSLQSMRIESVIAEHQALWSRRVSSSISDAEPASPNVDLRDIYDDTQDTRFVYHNPGVPEDTQQGSLRFLEPRQAPLVNTESEHYGFRLRCYCAIFISSLAIATLGLLCFLGQLSLVSPMVSMLMIGFGLGGMCCDVIAMGLNPRPGRISLEFEDHETYSSCCISF